MENMDMNELDVYIEGNYFAFDIWKRSYEIFSSQFAKELFYKRYIIAIENKGLSLLESCKELLDIYKKSLERFILLKKRCLHICVLSWQMFCLKTVINCQRKVLNIKVRNTQLREWK